MPDRLTPATDPDAVPLPARWKTTWTDAELETARPHLEEIARLVVGIHDRLEAATGAGPDDRPDASRRPANGRAPWT